MTIGPAFPLSAIVGQGELKLALLLNAVDPAIGGVLLRGEKGTAKSTAARALAALLPGPAPFVELPVGATEDRLVGTIDLRAALVEGERRFQPGLLHAVHGGVLYVDEVNLLPDHLVDVLLDVAASGVNRLEREGMSEEHPSRFVLIGSMNPEEGELRPQLLDRFGLAVEVGSSTDPGERALAVERRLAYDADPAGFARAWAAPEEDLRARLAALAGAAPAAPPAEVIALSAALGVEAGAEGLRADLVISRAAAALARWEGGRVAGPEDVRRVAPMALAHRRRRSPLDDHGMGEGELDAAMERAAARVMAPPAGEAGEERPVEPDDPSRVIGLDASGRRERRNQVATGRRSRVTGERGRLVADRVPEGHPSAVAVGATVAASTLRRGLAPEGSAVSPLEEGDIREPVRESREACLVVVAVDASASMGAPLRMEAAKGAVLSLLLDAYQRRDRVALVTFSGEGATVVLRPTGSVEVARARTRDLATGGRTPLARGILTALEVATRGGGGGAYRPLLVLVSDGRATWADGPGRDPAAAAAEAARRVRAQGVAAVVVDAEEGPTRLGLAGELAAEMGARHVRVGELSAGKLATAVADARWALR